jgi:dTDP-D-glucose 4,6-dehydratase
VDDRPFNDERYYICAKKLKSLGWSQKKTREDIYNHIRES